MNLDHLDFERRSDQRLLLRALKERWPVGGEGDDREVIVKMLKSKIQEAFKNNNLRTMNSLIRCLAELDKINCYAERNAASVKEVAPDDHVIRIEYDSHFFGNPVPLQPPEATEEE